MRVTKKLDSTFRCPGGGQALTAGERAEKQPQQRLYRRRLNLKNRKRKKKRRRRRLAPPTLLSGPCLWHLQPRPLPLLGPWHLWQRRQTSTQDCPLVSQARPPLLPPSHLAESCLLHPGQGLTQLWQNSS